MSEEETRERTSAILGCPVSDSAWTEAWEKAKRKIRHIAEFCGYDGCREQPGYMAQIAAEYIREAAKVVDPRQRRARACDQVFTPLIVKETKLHPKPLLHRYARRRTGGIEIV